MATGGNVLLMLCPNATWTIVGDSYNSIDWHGGEPSITESQFNAGFAQYDAWKAEQDAARAAAKADLLSRLGINEDEARLLLG